MDTEHLLLGLMEEHASVSAKPGFLGSKVTPDELRDIARQLFGRTNPISSPAKDLQFRRVGVGASAWGQLLGPVLWRVPESNAPPRVSPAARRPRRCLRSP